MDYETHTEFYRPVSGAEPKNLIFFTPAFEKQSHFWQQHQGNILKIKISLKFRISVDIWSFYAILLVSAH